MAARRLLGQVLKDLGAVHKGNVQEALMVQRDKGGRIGEILLQLGHIQRGDLARALATQAGMGFWDLGSAPPAPEAIAKVDLATARAFAILPVKLQGKVLTVALADPVNASMLQDLAFASGCEVAGVVADEALIQQGLDRFYRDDQALRHFTFGPGGAGTNVVVILLVRLSRIHQHGIDPLELSRLPLHGGQALAAGVPLGRRWQRQFADVVPLQKNVSDPLGSLSNLLSRAHNRVALTTFCTGYVRESLQPLENDAFRPRKKVEQYH